MRRGYGVPTLLVIAVLAALPARANEQSKVEEEYVRSIVTVLGIHAQSMRRLSAHQIPYSVNMVRHATAIRWAFGLLGPMEWHAAKAIQLSHETGPDRALDEETFDALTERNRAALKFLDVAAHRWLKDRNRDLLIEALDDLVTTCNDCHARLPAGSVPDITGPMMAE